MDVQSISQLFDHQKQFFREGHTRPLSYRRKQLEKLRKLIITNEALLFDALHSDLNKAPQEAYGTEVGYVLKELRLHLKKLKSWARPTKVASPLLLFRAKSSITYEPKGTVLIISTWNYPFQLIMAPLIGAIAAGNTVILKPSEIAKHTALILKELINNAFDERMVHVVNGGVEVAQHLIQLPFDHVFFTGSSAVGKIILRETAKNLVPVTLELGGKSPCIVDQHAHIKLSARRIIWGKLINAGQTCVAPDYLLVHESIVGQLLEEMVACIKEFYGDDPAQSREYPCIVNQAHMERLVQLLEDARVYHGGAYNMETKYFEPTLLTDVRPDMAVMQQEVFGPILPVISYKSIDEVIKFVNDRPKPLALYIFSGSKKTQKELLLKLPAGGVTINDTLMHFANSNLPFGGVGNSGMGQCHGRYSFELFTNQKPVVYKYNWPEIALRYPPYAKKLKWIRLIMR